MSNSVPDNWEHSVASNSAAMADKKNFNVNASVFVPGRFGGGATGAPVAASAAPTPAPAASTPAPAPAPAAPPAAVTPAVATTEKQAAANHDNHAAAAAKDDKADAAASKLTELEITEEDDEFEGESAKARPRGKDAIVTATNVNEVDVDWEALESASAAADGDEVVTKPVATKKIESSGKSDEVRKEHLNFVFVGHVDAGKSTIGGHMLYLTGMIDKRTLEKYEREASEINRQSWYLSWALDNNKEEREKGITIEVGRANFDTELKNYTILDAPGHKSFVPNMISGAAQADIAVMVISARKGEFETGFEKGGQTREHAMLVKTVGIRYMVVLVNKMDDPTVEWSVERYNECRNKLTLYLKSIGFNVLRDVHFMPVSGLTGAFLKEVPSESICSWYRGPSFLDYLDQFPSAAIQRQSGERQVRVPIAGRYQDMGTIVLGKLETGVVRKNDSLVLMPNKTSVQVMQLFSDENEADAVFAGDNIKLKLKGVEEQDVSPGFVLCSPDNLCRTATVFDAQIMILDAKSIICAGYSCIIHVHTVTEEVTIRILICLLDKRTQEKTTVRPRFIKQDQAGIVRFQVNNGAICIEAFKDLPQMSRFTLRDETRTVAIGKVLKVVQ